MNSLPCETFGPIALAPLRGVTDHLFRTAFAAHFDGIDWAIAPFVTTVAGTGVTESHIRDLLPEHNQAMPVVPQVIGNDPSQLVNTVNAIHGLGYELVDWNLGCPFAKVTRKKRGSGLLPHTDRIVDTLAFVLPRLHGRLSLKVRLGLTSADDLAALLPRLDELPVAQITVHARTGSQMYTGQVDLDAFERCLPLTRHPVIYNGDITTEEGFGALKERFGSKVVGWMVGRGAVRDPFLPARMQGLPLPDMPGRIDTIRAFHDDLFARCQAQFPGPAALLGHMKELWRLLGQWMPNSERLVGKLCRAGSVGGYERAVEKIVGDWESGGKW